MFLPQSASWLPLFLNKFFFFLGYFFFSFFNACSVLAFSNFSLPLSFPLFSLAFPLFTTPLPFLVAETWLPQLQFGLVIHFSSIYSFFVKTPSTRTAPRILHFPDSASRVLPWQLSLNTFFGGFLPTLFFLSFRLLFRNFPAFSITHSPPFEQFNICFFSL